MTDYFKYREKLSKDLDYVLDHALNKDTHYKDLEKEFLQLWIKEYQYLSDDLKSGKIEIKEMIIFQTRVLMNFATLHYNDRIVNMDYLHDALKYQSEAFAGMLLEQEYAFKGQTDDLKSQINDLTRKIDSLSRKLDQR